MYKNLNYLLLLLNRSFLFILFQVLGNTWNDVWAAQDAGDLFNQKKMTATACKVLLRSLPELYQETTLDTLPRRMLDFVARLIPADALAFNEFRWSPPGLQATTTPPELSTSKYIQKLTCYLTQDPVIRHRQETGDISARKISDFVSPAQYHRLPVYQEVYRHINAEDQFSVALRLTSSTIVSLAINRDRPSFTAEDRVLLNLAQPHLAQAYQNAETATQLQGRLGRTWELLETLPTGVIVLDRQMRIAFATVHARQLLQQYFTRSKLIRRPPAALQSWVRQQCQGSPQPQALAVGFFVKESAAGTLIVRSAPGKDRGEIILLLEENEEKATPMRPPETLQRLGLTRREAEVLLWVAQGKTNPEIAIILHAASRTVGKHLERIFAKLGVATRTDAARRALEFFSPALRSI